MSVRMKVTHSKTASRRSHHRAGVPTAVKTEHGTRRRHFVDPVTGMYRGKQILPSSISVATTKPATKKTTKQAVTKEKTA